MSYLVGFFAPWIAKTVLYHFAFRWRHIRATIQTKLIVAGAPLIVKGLLPFPLPGLIPFLLGVGLGIYLCKEYTDGKLYPDIIGIVIGIEFIAIVIIANFLAMIL